MTILLILTCLLSASIFTLSLFKRDKIWPRVSLLENIASSLGLIGSILLAVFYTPVSAGAAVIYSLSIAGALFGNFAPMILTFVMFIFVSNIAGLFGLHPPTANVAITVALGFIAAFVIHIAGIKEGGFKNWLKGFLDPSPIMLPLNIISEIVTPFSLGMRLFGNILSGVVIMNLVYGALTSVSVGSFPLGGVIAPFVTPAFHAIFDVFFGAIQTYVFALLTIVFISGKIPEQE